MDKQITINLTQQEYDNLQKLWNQVKDNPMFPIKPKDFDDFCKQIIISFAHVPHNFQSPFKNMNINFEELLKQLGDLSKITNIFSSNNNTKNNTDTNQKKNNEQDDKKYKS